MDDNEGLRLKLLLDKKWGLKKELAEMMGVSPQAVSQMYEKERFDNEKIKQILEFFGFTSRSEFHAASDLLIKSHAVAMDDFDSYLSTPSKKYRQSLEVRGQDYEKNILFVPQEAEAGFLAGEVSPITNDDLKVYSGMPGFEKPGFAFTVKGESMEATIRSGEIIVTSKDNITDITKLRPEHLYVIEFNEAILVKRLKDLDMKGGTVTFSSDNDDKIRFPDLKLELTAIRKIFKGRRIISFNLSKRLSYSN